MSDDLVEFLRARLDEDERAAKAATPGPWRHDESKHWRKPGTSWFEEAVFAGPSGEEATCVAGTGETDDRQSMRDAAHIALNDPARVLREVEAKRRLLEWHRKPTMVEFSNGTYRTMGCRCYDGWPCSTMRLLALPFDYHPDYRADWRP